jgi:hypothetical protein
MTKVLAGAAALAATVALANSAVAAASTTYAVIGDTPYGSTQVANFPNDVADINADPAVALGIHLGDIKNGSSRCDTSYFEQIRADFDLFQDPLVYTPGDNEWTDCHREQRRLLARRPGAVRRHSPRSPRRGQEDLLRPAGDDARAGDALRRLPARLPGERSLERRRRRVRSDRPAGLEQ